MVETSPSFRRRRLGRRLRQLREKAGLTLDEAAKLLEKHRLALWRIENGQTKADVHLVRSMMDVYDVRDDQLLNLARDAARKGWWRQYGLADLGYVDVETEAVRVLEYAVQTIPGLLQTEAYLRAHMAGASLPRTPEEIENQVKVRQIRQERLTDDEYPLELVAVIDEAALHRPIGGPDVMRAQLTHLQLVGELDRVTVQILPYSAGRHDGMNGAFTVLEFPEPDDPELLYVHHVAGAPHLEKAEDVRAARMTHDKLRAQALTPEESVRFIERLVQQFPKPERGRRVTSGVA